jgi:hypothetical protein
MNKLIASCIVVLLFGSCQKSDPVAAPVIPVPDDFFTVYYEITSLPISSAFTGPEKIGTVNGTDLIEISGIGASYSQPNSIWVEQDSGNGNLIYLIRTDGTRVGTFRLSSLQNRDWEDLSVAPGPTQGTHYLYLADIGDNKNASATKYIHRIPEPSAVDIAAHNEPGPIETMTFKYPDKITNAEAVMIDPSTKDVFVVSKEGQATIYVARYPQDVKNIFTMVKVGVLPISDVTAADISPDGTEVLIKNYSMILYWKKSGNETISELLKKTPVRAPYQPEEKGESICWITDGSGYLTTSELGNQPIYFYRRKP